MSAIRLAASEILAHPASQVWWDVAIRFPSAEYFPLESSTAGSVRGPWHRPSGAELSIALPRSTDSCCSRIWRLRASELRHGTAQIQIALLEFLALLKQFDEDIRLASEDQRVDWFEQVVHRTFLIARKDMGFVFADGREENDGDDGGSFRCPASVPPLQSRPFPAFEHPAVSGRNCAPKPIQALHCRTWR
jgi:hypothetical protein